MLESLVLWVGTLAFVTSIGTVTAGATIYARTGNGADVIDTVGGLVSAVLWFVFSYGVSNVETVAALQSEAVTVSTGHEMLSYVGVALGALMVIIALMGTGSLVDVRDVVAR